jgi:DNA-binding NarL/FixJ family response regulator
MTMPTPSRADAGRAGPDRAAVGPVRVLVVDDEALIRAGFRVLVDSAPGLDVVGEASNGADAVRQTRALHPDVVLMDLRMPVMDGLEATRHIVSDAGGARVLVVTTFDEDEHVFLALRAGASGFVLKDTPPEKLLEAIHVVAAGESLLAPAVTRRLIAAYVRRAPAAGAPGHDALTSLTPREREVLVQVASGRSNAEIAEAMVLGTTTIKTHVGRLLAKLGARDRAQLVVLAYESGLVSPRG